MLAIVGPATSLPVLTEDVLVCAVHLRSCKWHLRYCHLWIGYTYALDAQANDIKEQLGRTLAQ